MARAFNLAQEAGRLAYKAGLADKIETSRATSSPYFLDMRVSGTFDSNVRKRRTDPIC